MVEESRSTGIGERFSAYIEELRDFFGSRNVPFGSPADVVAFADRVAEPGSFQDEMGSLVRSIVYREGDGLGRGELLALVAVAVGGPEVEAAAQEMHASVRQIFVFVNGALRQQHRMIPDELVEEEKEVPVTAGHILAATPGRSVPEEQPVAGRTPGNGFYAGGSEPRGEAVPPRRSEPAGSGMLFKAVTMAESEKDELDDEAQPRGVRPWLVPAVVAVAAVLGVGAYLLKSPNGHGAGLQAPGAPLSASLQGTAAAGSCVSGMTPGTRRATVEERSRWAHNLLDQKLYEAALPELQDVARIDPAYPGINLDQSQALLQMKRPDEARSAIDNQINISDCLSRLPAAALDAYCSSEFSPSTVSNCRPQLAHIREAAELQAALVHLELGHRAAPDGSSAELTTADVSRAAGRARGTVVPPRLNTPAPVEAKAHRPLPPATEGDAARVAGPEQAAAARSGVSRSAGKRDGDESLRRGEGTDSVFGAYSKPQ